jgi:hypothetical protein
MQGQGEVSLPLDAILLYCLIFIKDAILGLQELLDSNWHLITPNLTSLLSALVRLLVDEVRFLSIINRHMLMHF